MVFGKHINRYYLKYALPLLGGLLALFLVDYLQLLIPAFYRTVINGINSGVVEEGGVTVPFDLSYLVEEVCLPMVFVILALVFGRFLWRVCLLSAAVGMETDVRIRMFDRAKELSQEYYQRNKVGDLMSLFTNDLDTVQECFGWGFLHFFDAMLLGTMAIVKMWRMDMLLTLLSLIPMALLFASSAVISRVMMQKWDRRQAVFSKLSDTSQESFSGIAVIKAFVKEGRELLAFRRLNAENEDANVDYTRSSVLLRVLVTLFVESVMCVILGYGGYLVYIDRFDPGQLIEFIGYFTSIVWPIMAISELIDMTSRGRASVKRISSLLDAKITVTDREGVVPLAAPVSGAIEFRHLTFRYPDAEIDALKDVSFTVEPGESVGIIGKTGAGKSTVVDLLLRTYNVPDGTVFLDGKDVNTIPIREVRAACAYVPQDNFLFSDTIAGNIAFSDRTAARERIEEVARWAAVDGNIREFTLGYDTVLGERGVTVSGGQKQRISIARALLKDAPILILDDSVSAVDTATERVILDHLSRVRRGKTTLLVAHRISTVKDMDKILFIEDGGVLAMGTHEQLCRDCEAYRRTVELQRLEDESRDDPTGVS